ncbi:uncharacterized protein LOC114960803 [Acropora millepora]|uniref:uncharacterized protein LOC114960803 n=1 Tax=Acropora millepora TaxID=45264 RepID=UPI001CF4D997|nr:uncharacterized protein LOC114960803 [Acropora millepora]
MAAVYSCEKRKSICSQGTSARDKNRLSPYRKMLLDLSRNLPNDDLEAFKFACLDRIPLAKSEKVTAGFQLFDLLEQKGAITPQNLTFLEDMMRAIGRDDLASKVNQFMKDKCNEMKFDAYDGNYTDDDVPIGARNNDAFNNNCSAAPQDEGDEVVYFEVSDEIEKKAWAICSPMYNQRSGQLLNYGFCGILKKKRLPNICDMKRFNIINLWNNAVTFKNIIAIILIIFIMRVFKKEDIETQCVIEGNRIDLYFKDYKLAIVCDKNAPKHMDSYKAEEFKGKNLRFKFIRFNPGQLRFEIIDVLREINEFIMKEKGEWKSEFTNAENKMCNTCYDENHQILKKVFEGIIRMFKNEDIETQFVIEEYRIDLYFKRYKLAIECEENSSKQVDSDKEKRRQELIEKNLVCKFIRFNPDQSGFNIIDVLSEIYEFIMKEKEENGKLAVIASAVSAGRANLQVISRI